LKVSDAFFVAGFGLALLSLVWSDQAWRALSNDGTFMKIEGDLNFWRSFDLLRRLLLL
jgi:hypothetical protein